MIYLVIVVATMNPEAYDLALSDLKALKAVANDAGNAASKMQSFAAALRNIATNLETSLSEILKSDDHTSSREYQFGDADLERHLEITDNRITALVAKLAANKKRVDELESKITALSEQATVQFELSTNVSSATDGLIQALIAKVNKLEGQVPRQLDERFNENETEVYHVWTQVDVNTEMISALNIRVNELELKTLVDRCNKNNFKQLPKDKLKLPSSCDSMCATKGTDGAVLVKCPNRRDEQFEKAKLQERFEYEVTKTPSNTPDTQPSGDERPDQDIQ
jgi:polyhydroxyalkanoate synthesis regulator phasin